MSKFPEDVFNSHEDDEEEDDDSKPSTSTTSTSAAEAILNLFKKEQKPESEKEQAPEEKDTGHEELLIEPDKTPELDSEAPFEHLSEVEELAINQALAEDRLRDVRTETEAEPAPEQQAAQDYLEAVVSTGYVDLEYQNALNELGVTKPQEESIPLPVASQSNPLESPSPVMFSEESKPAKQAAKVVEKNKPSLRKETAEVVDYLLSRRKARIEPEAKVEPVRQDLSKEVDQLRINLLTREAHIRQLAAAKETPTRIETLKARPKETAENNQQVQAEVKAQTMSREELIKVASKIEVDEVKLSAMFSNGLLGEKGLRRVVAEYLKGGNIKKILSKELIEREIDFERDPVFRDSGGSTLDYYRPSSVDALVKQSGIEWGEDRNQVVKTAPQKSAVKRLTTNITSSSPRRMIDIVMIFLILALLIALLVIIYTR